MGDIQVQLSGRMQLHPAFLHLLPLPLTGGGGVGGGGAHAGDILAIKTTATEEEEEEEWVSLLAVTQHWGTHLVAKTAGTAAAVIMPFHLTCPVPAAPPL